MSLRFTDPEQLEHVSGSVREQLKACLTEIEAAPTPGELLARLSGDPAPPARKKRRGRPEQEAGRALMAWIDHLVLPNGLRPGLYFAHTPNGGFRDPVEAAIFYGQGVRRGWPDYTLYLPRGRYHGLVGELKAVDGAKPDAEQLEILARLEAVGFKACVWWGFEDARRQLRAYLDLAG